MNGFKLRAAVALIFAAGAAQAVDLASVYQNAKEYDATYATAAANFEAGKEKAEQGQSLIKPNVTLSGNYTSQSGTQTEPGIDPNTGNLINESISGTSKNMGYQVQARQVLFDATAFAGRSQLQEQTRMAEITFHAAEQDLIVRVSQAYFDVLLAQDSLAFVRAQKNAVSEQLAQAKKSFEVGVATITDTNEAQAQYDNILAQEIGAENDLLVKQAAFQQLTGVAPENLAPLGAHQRPATPEPDDVSIWMKRSEDLNPQIASKRSALTVADREIEKYQALRQPTLYLQGGYSDSKTDAGLALGGNSSTRGTSIGLNLSIPLYTGGNTSSKLRESLRLRDAARSDLEATTRSVTLATRQAFLGVKSGAAQIKALEQALVSAQSSLDSTKLGKEVGVRTTLDLLNVQQTYFQTKRDLANARYQYELSRLKLAQSVGNLNPNDVLAVNNELGN